MLADLSRNLHGASTHFPIALLLSATVVEALGFIQRNEQRRQRWRGASQWMLALGALGALPAVFSGLLLTRGEIGGTGLLWRHHAFVWPAFGLLLGLAVWRVRAGDDVSRGALAVYFVCMCAAAVLMGAAGYYGGELAGVR